MDESGLSSDDTRQGTHLLGTLGAANADCLAGVSARVTPERIVLAPTCHSNPKAHASTTGEAPGQASTSRRLHALSTGPEYSGWPSTSVLLVLSA